jgi:hypothetical protein
MNIANKYFATGLITTIFFLTACDSKAPQENSVAVDQANADSAQIGPTVSTTSDTSFNRTKPAFAIFSPVKGEIYVLMKPISATADMIFKNSCKSDSQPIGVANINFDGRLYCSDVSSRAIQVLQLDTGVELFSWPWPADIASTAKWNIGRWQAGQDVGLVAYDPANGVFTAFNPGDKNFVLSHAFFYGGVDESIIPLVGDWDGNGADSVGVFRSAMKQADLRNSLEGGLGDISFGFADGTVVPDALPAIVNVEERTVVTMYSSKQGVVVLGSADQAQTQILFAIPVR